jgi:drug/metabolite transporter (DMT)-like permease
VAWPGYLLVAAAAISWGAQSAIAKLLLTSGSSPAALVSARTATAFLLMAAALGLADRRLLRTRPRELGHLALLGIVGMALSQYGYYAALTRIPVATALLIIYTSPLFVLAGSALWDREPLRAGDVIAAVVTLAGAGLVIRAHGAGSLGFHAVGVMAAFLSALTFAFYSLWARRMAPRVSPWTGLTYSLGCAALFWIPVAPPWAFLSAEHPPRMWLAFAVVVVFGTLVPFGLYLAGLRWISAAHANITSTIEPVVAAAGAYVVLGEALAWPQLVGGLLVLSGVAALQIRPRGGAPTTA